MTALISVSSPSMMRGLATETMVVSIRIMKNPMTRDQSAGHGLVTFSKSSAQQFQDVVPGEHPGGVARRRGAGVGICSRVNQCPGDVRVALEHRAGQRGLPAVVGGVGVTAVVQDELHGLSVAV